MWTIIKRIEDATFDLVPNCWLLDTSSCYYPDVGLKTTKTFALRCKEPDETWDILTVEIVDKDIDNYERGMTNVIRYTKGKRSLTSSEEDRSKNKRKKFRKSDLYESDFSHGDMSLSSSNDEEQRPLKKNRFEIKKTEKSKTKPTTVPVLSNITVPTTPPPPLKLTPNKPPNTTPTHSLSETPVRKQAGCCKLPKNRKHYCVFEMKKDVTMESVGHALCVITRKLEIHNSNSVIIKEELQELRRLLENKNNTTETQEKSKEAREEETSMVWREFPLKNTAEVEAMEEKLKAKDFFQACVVHFSAAAEMTSEARTVTSIMAKMLTLEAAMCYTWKGVIRKDHRIQKKPFKNLALSHVLLAATKRCWPHSEKGKVEISASSWIAQAKAKTDRLLAKKVVAEENHEEVDVNATF